MWDIGTKFVISNNDETDEGEDIVYTIACIDKFNGEDWVTVEYRISGSGMDDSFKETYVEESFKNGEWVLV